jgi:hypothetical protein
VDYLLNSSKKVLARPYRQKNMQLFITHQEFKEGYKSGKFSISAPNKEKLDTLLSSSSEEAQKYVNIFWSFLHFLVPIIPISFVKKYFTYGLNNYDNFILRKMLNDENFFQLILLRQEVKIFDREGNNYVINESEKKLLKTDWGQIFLRILAVLFLVIWSFLMIKHYFFR